MATQCVWMQLMDRVNVALFQTEYLDGAGGGLPFVRVRFG
jgi:hypothetical protein